MAGAKELLCMIQDLQNTVVELKQRYKEQRLPVTDGSRELQGLCAQLEFLLQFDLKEKRSFFGQRRDYWDFLCHGLARRRQGHEGVQFVSCLEKLRTPVGKGRAFIRYCLVHQLLAESLQLCFLDPELTSEWYYARSPFLHPHLRTDIMACLYELDGITFHLALKRPDLDAAWPMVSETLSRNSSQSPMNSQMEGTACQVGNPGGARESQHGARRIPQEESQLLGLVSRSIGPSTDDRHQPRSEESREGPSPAVSLKEHEDRGQQVGPQHQVFEVAGDSQQRIALPASGEQETELQWANTRLQTQIKTQGEELSHSLPTTPELESLLGQREQRGGKESEATQRFARELEEQARQIRELQDSKAFLSDTLEEMDVLASALRCQLSQREEEMAVLLAAQREQQQELEAQLAEEKRRQEELTERLSQAMHDAKREAEVAAEAQAQRAATIEALEETEQRLRAESRKHLSGAEAQELRHQQLLSRCRGLEEKLSASEGRLEEKEAQLVALRSQMQPGGANSSPQRDPRGETEATLEAKLRQAELQAEGLREKLERGLLERKELEMEREALLESAVSQGQTLAAARLEAQDLREELEGQQAKLQEALARNAALASQLAETTTGFASEKAHLERAVAELRRQLVASEEQTRQEREEGARLQKEEQRLQATLQGACEERDTLASQVQTTAAARESHAQEVALLRSQLEELKASSQREETRLQATLAVALRERDTLAQQKEEGDQQISVLREEVLRLQHQLQRLDLEKQRAADSLEQARGQLTAAQMEKDAMEKMITRAAAELEQTGECGRPKAGGEEAMALSRGRGLVEKKTAGQAGLKTGKRVPPGEMPEELEAMAKQEKASAEPGPRKSIEEMVKLLTTHLEKEKGDAQQKGQLLTAKEEEMKHLMDQLGRAQQDGERFRLALEKAEKDAKEREKKLQEQLAEQKELVRDMKGRLLELLREKDALWQKMEGIDPQAPGAASQELGLCIRCNQDFRFLTRRYQCRLCQGPVCQTCSVESGRRGRCCLLCWQKRNFKGS